MQDRQDSPCGLRRSERPHPQPTTENKSRNTGSNRFTKKGGHPPRGHTKCGGSNKHQTDTACQSSHSERGSIPSLSLSRPTSHPPHVFIKNTNITTPASPHTFSNGAIHKGYSSREERQRCTTSAAILLSSIVFCLLGSLRPLSKSEQISGRPASGRRAPLEHRNVTVLCGWRGGGHSSLDLASFLPLKTVTKRALHESIGRAWGTRLHRLFAAD